MNKKMKKILKKIKKNYRLTEKEIKALVAEMYEEYGDDLEKELYKYNRNLRLNSKISTLVFDLYKENRKVVNTLLREVSKTATKEIKGIRADIDINQIINDDISGLKWIERQNLHRDETVKMIQSEIVRGIRNGERYEAVAKNLSNRLNVSLSKTERVVRTESHRCINQSKFESYKDFKKKGFKIKKKWVAANDERTRSSHAELDGQVVDIDKPFKIHGKEAMHPGGFGLPEEDINCRCTMQLIIE